MCEAYTWALTWEWALSTHLEKMSTWAFARETMVVLEPRGVICSYLETSRAL